MNKQQLVVVTGGAGFIGSHLCERLAKDGHHVISVDNYFTGRKENHVDGVEYRTGHTKDIEKLVPETPDVIYHLGEYARVAKSITEPDVVFDLNMVGTFGVLEFWRKRNRSDQECKLVYAGSSTKHAGMREDGVAGRDLSPYTWTKAAHSDLVNNYGRWFNLPYAIVYFYNVYGPRERGGVDEYGTVVETFKRCFLQGKPCEVRSPGTQTRSFTHVEDTVSALVLVGEKGQGDEYGISAQEEYSLVDVANMFGTEIVMLPRTASSRSTGATDTTKIKELQWKQKHTLKEYVEDVKRSAAKT